MDAIESNVAIENDTITVKGSSILLMSYQTQTVVYYKIRYRH